MKSRATDFNHSVNISRDENVGLTRRNNPKLVEEYAPIFTLTEDTPFHVEMHKERGAEIEEILSQRKNPLGGYENVFYDSGLVRWLSAWMNSQPLNTRREMLTRLCELWVPPMEFARRMLPIQGDSAVNKYLTRSELESYGGQYSLEAPFLAIYQRTACIFFSIVHACVTLDEGLLDAKVEDFLSSRVLSLSSLIDVQLKSFERACLASNFNPRDPDDVLRVLSIAESIQTSEFDTGEGLEQKTDAQKDMKIFKVLINTLLERTLNNESNVVLRHFWALDEFVKTFIVSDIASPLEVAINKMRYEFRVFLNFNARTTDFKDEVRELGSAVLASLDYIRTWSYYVGGVWMEENVEKTFRSRGELVEKLMQHISDKTADSENNAQKALDACQTLFIDIRPLAETIFPFLPFDIRLVERYARGGRNVKEMAYLLNCSERVIRHVLTEVLNLDITDKGVLPKSELRRYVNKTQQDVERIEQAYKDSQGSMDVIRKMFKYSITAAEFEHFRYLFGIADVEFDSRTTLEAFAHLNWGNTTEEYNTIAADFLRVPTYKVIANIKQGKYGPMPSGRTINYKIFRELMKIYCPSINLDEYAYLKPRADWRYDIEIRMPK